MSALTVPSKHSPAPQRLTKAERTKLLAEMPAPLQEEAVDIETELRKAATDMVRYNWQLGVRLAKMDTEAEKYGVNSISQLARYLGMNPDDLGICITFAERYNEKELTSILETQRPDGKTLTWSHVESLVRIEDKRARAKLEKIAVQECLGYRELADRVAATIGGKNPKRSAGAGRPQRMPKHLRGAMEQIHSRSLTFRKSLDITADPENGLIALYDRTPPDSIDQRTIEATQMVKEDLVALDNELSKVIREVDRVHLKLEAQRTAEVAKRAKDIGYDEDEDGPLPAVVKKTIPPYVAKKQDEEE